MHSASSPSPRSRRPARRWLAGLAVVAVAACGDSGTEPAPLPVTVSVTPSSATVGAAGQQSLTATVSNADNTSVTWTSSGGSVSGSGSSVTWTAPVTGGSYTVTATSAEDASASASATITVTPVQVSVSPAAPALLRGEPTTFTAAVSGTAASTDVTWTATCGTLTANGATADYEAPLESGTCEVTATSALDATMSGTAQVAVRAASVVSVEGDADDGACTWDDCSLREAIDAANTAAGTDTIYLSTAAAGVSAAASGPAAVITVDAPLPTITSDLAIIGEGPDLTDIDLGGAGRAFDVSAEGGPANVTIRGLTVRNGSQAGGGLVVRDGAVFHGMDLAFRGHRAVAGSGGAMVVVGSETVVVLDNVDFDDNRTLGNYPGGALELAGGSFSMRGGSFTNNQSPAWGGAVRGFNTDRVHFEGTVFDGNAVLAGGFGGGAMFIENPAGEDGVVILDGVTITDNTTATGGNGGGGAYLRSGLDVTITDATITGNDGSDTGWGGGLHLQGSQVTITNSTIQGNAAQIGGGIYLGDADVTLTETAVDGNTGQQRGGGIFSAGTTSLMTTGGSVSGNSTGTGDGAGMVAQQDSDVEFMGTVFVGNQVPATSVGGAMSLFGNSQLTGTSIELRDNMAGAGGGIYYAGAAGSTLALDDAAISGNHATGQGFSGGGLFAEGDGAITITNSTITDNEAEDGSGGGIFAFAPVAVDVSGSVLTNNRATVSGGGLWTRGPTTITTSHFQGNDAGSNGGGFIGGSPTTVTRSTFDGNTAGAKGGGIFVVQDQAATPRIVNTTISGNTALDGGGVATLGALDLIHVSLVGNMGTASGGGAYVYSTGSNSIVGALQATNTVFQGNTGPAGALSCTVAGGSAASSGGNVTDDTSCGFAEASDQSGVDPMVDPTLADNGGSTPTHAPLAGSPVLDAGVDAGVTDDQTGAARSDGAPDAGAKEGVAGG